MNEMAAKNAKFNPYHVKELLPCKREERCVHPGILNFVTFTDDAWFKPSRHKVAHKMIQYLIY
jgi:hypothetical protein